jgi:NACalpha-BTF3-like transcription factor
LIIIGEYDIPDCHAHAGAIETGIAGSQRVIINKAGHIVTLEQPAVFNEVVLTFLRQKKFFEILGQQKTGKTAKETREHDALTRLRDARRIQEASKREEAISTRRGRRGDRKATQERKTHRQGESWSAFRSGLFLRAGALRFTATLRIS